MSHPLASDGIHISLDFVVSLLKTEIIAGFKIIFVNFQYLDLLIHFKTVTIGLLVLKIGFLGKIPHLFTLPLPYSPSQPQPRCNKIKRIIVVI